MVLGLFLLVLMAALYALSLVALKSVESEVKLAPQKVLIEPRRQR